MAIYALTGRPRHGKTLELARIGSKLLKKKERIFSNLKFNLGVGALKKFNDNIIGELSSKADRDNPEKLLFYWNNLHEWEHMEKGNIFVDEMTRYFNPRQWAQLSEDTEIKLQQHGKDSLNVYGTVQHYSRIDISLRLLVEKFYIVKTIFGNPDNRKPFLGIKIMSIYGVELEDIEDLYQMWKRPDLKLEIPYTKKTRLFKKKYAIIYDTYQKVGRSEAMPLVHKARLCPICGKEEIKHV